MQAVPDNLADSRPRRDDVWSIVLAGGEGTRLRPLIRRLFGEDRPKQFAPLVGSRSLLRATLDRIGREVALERTVVLTSQWHAQYAAAEFAAGPQPRLLVQPRNRGTAAGVLFPVHWVKRQNPDAILAVFPSDHFVSNDAAFMSHVADVTDSARRHPDQLILVGATPTSPECGYGWIEPEDDLEAEASGEIRRVRRFWEKPSDEVARSCFQKGHLWNTFVMVGSVAAFAEAGRRLLPRLHEQLERIAPFLNTPAEPAMVDQAYAASPAADFSRAVLEARPASLAASRLPPVGWSDWGTQERVVASLSTAGIFPPWLPQIAATA